MTRPSRIQIPLRTAMVMVGTYARGRLTEQVKAVAFIILYLAGFQVVVLGTTPSNAWQISAGVGLVVVGLACFLEGLLLGLMPLGERVGLQLPHRAGLKGIVAFGLLLGMGATLAEPAIAALRAAGQTVTPWGEPLLFRLLENEPDKLVLAIGAGVGVAVAIGMLRFHYGLSIKPFVYVVVPVLLVVSMACTLDANLGHLLGLAWDAGAVTTGPVTVPLVLALGIGVSRAVGKREGATAGFGIVMLASAFPVLGVLLLGAVLNASTPRPTSETAFFAAERRGVALQLVSSEENLRRMAFQRGEAPARRALFRDETTHRDAVRSLADPVARRAVLGTMSLQEWLQQRASETERTWVPAESFRSAASVAEPRLRIVEVLRTEAVRAVRAVVPLAALLLVALVAFLRDRPRHRDEVVFGIALGLIGMTLLTSGIRLGLAPLGDEVGRPLPRVFRSVAREEGRVVLEPFDPELVLTSFAADGTSRRFFYLHDPTGIPRPVPFDPQRFDPGTRRYEHILNRPPLFGPELTLVGIGLVLLFAFGMGYGATLAEPALAALGRTVEELTVGTVKRTGVVRAVSIGVGVGLVVGVARILYGVPILWLIVPPYVALLPLTYWSEEDFAGIAWDSGGVTTGSITVPLVLAMGLGIGGELKVADGFGVLAMASVFPIIAVLLYGLAVQARQRHSIQASIAEEHDE